MTDHRPGETTDEYIKRLVAEAPPLSDEQVRTIASALGFTVNEAELDATREDRERGRADYFAKRHAEASESGTDPD